MAQGWNNFKNVKNILNSFEKAPIFEINPSTIQQMLEKYSMRKKIDEANAIKNMVNNKLNPIINDSSIIKNQLANNMQNKIEAATAKGLLGGDNPLFIAKEDMLKPIDDLLKNAKSNIGKMNRGIITESSPLKFGGPTSSSISKQLPMVVNSTSLSKVKFQPIKGLGGIGGTGLMLSDAAKEAADWAWRQGNLNTMVPSQRNAILRAAGRENEIANYTRQNDTLDDLPMPALSKLVANLTQRGVDKLINYSQKQRTNSNDSKVNDLISDYNKSKANKNNTGTGVGSSQSAINIARQLANEIVNQPQEFQQQQTGNLQAINDYISQLKDINQPYIEVLQNYVDRYNQMYNQSQLANRRLRDLSVITGDPTWYQSAKDYNQLNQEANRIAAIKQLQDAQAGDVNAINEVMGNIAIAQEMGLPYESAFANKNLLTAMTMRDKNLTNREIAELNNAAKLQIALQNAQNRLAVQNLRNQGSLGVANVYMGGVAPGLNAQGTLPTQKEMSMAQALNGIR